MKRTIPWQAARARSQQPARRYKPCGPVGPHVAVFKSGTGASVNGVPMDRKIVFSLGIDVPELGISAYGPDGPEAGKRGDGRLICQACGYALCSCRRLTEFGKAFASCPPLEPTRSTIKARIDTIERLRELGMLDTPGQREAVFRALLDGDMSGFGVKP